MNLNVDLGPVLEEGGSYRLEVSPQWKTEKGTHLSGALSKAFEVGGIDRAQPDPAKWKLHRESETKLVVNTDGTLDTASSRKRLSVVRENEELRVTLGISVRGSRVTLDLRQHSPHEVYIFKEWAPGRYRLKIDPELEDLAGNSIARPFNLDLEKHPDFVEKTEPVTLPFRITEFLEIELTSP